MKFTCLFFEFSERFSALTTSFTKFFTSMKNFIVLYPKNQQNIMNASKTIQSELKNFLSLIQEVNNDEPNTMRYRILSKTHTHTLSLCINRFIVLRETNFHPLSVCSQKVLAGVQKLVNVIEELVMQYEKSVFLRLNDDIDNSFQSKFDEISILGFDITFTN